MSLAEIRARIRIRTEWYMAVRERGPDGRWRVVGTPSVRTNLLTLSGIDWMHTQLYGSSGLSTNGLIWCILGNGAFTETQNSTALANEITGNGLQRAIFGSIVHTAGSNLTTLQHDFTATGSQDVNKGGAGTASSGGVVQHLAPAASTLSLLTGQQLRARLKIWIPV